MSFFESNHGTHFNLAKFEASYNAKQTGNNDVDTSLLNTIYEKRDAVFGAGDGADAASNDDQFVVFQLSDGDKRILQTSEVTPSLKGAAGTPDINMQIEIDSFKVSNRELVKDVPKATLQLTIGQEKKITGLDQLFYCINAGLELWKSVEGKGKAADPKDFRKDTDAALGNKPISLPGGAGQIIFNVVKHKEPAWWQQLFNFAGSNTGKELLSLTGFGGITEAAFNQVNNMLNTLLAQKLAPETLFKSVPIKLAFSEAARSDLSGGLSTNYVSCLNPGYWIMARQKDYDTILKYKPIYYSGVGLLAPDGTTMNNAMDNNKNPFSEITYTVIRARMKEVDLKQNVF